MRILFTFYIMFTPLMQIDDDNICFALIPIQDEQKVHIMCMEQTSGLYFCSCFE